MSMTDEIRRLHELHQCGALSDGEFAQAKAALLNSQPAAASQVHSDSGKFLSDPSHSEEQTRQWAMFLHLSQFAGYAIPLAGFVVPIVLWQLKKSELPEIDAHGKLVANWIISSFLYLMISFVLTVAIIGVPLMVVVLVLDIVFPIVGAIKANEGKAWQYPLSIPFFT